MKNFSKLTQSSKASVMPVSCKSANNKWIFSIRMANNKRKMVSRSLRSDINTKWKKIPVTEFTRLIFLLSIEAQHRSRFAFCHCCCCHYKRQPNTFQQCFRCLSILKETSWRCRLLVMNGQSTSCRKTIDLCTAFSNSLRIAKAQLIHSIDGNCARINSSLSRF